jgi:hypothetical protein
MHTQTSAECVGVAVRGRARWRDGPQQEGVAFADLVEEPLRATEHPRYINSALNTPRGAPN